MMTAKMWDLFGYDSFFGDGLHIIWVDCSKESEVEFESGYRKNLNDGNQQPDRKKWRFYRK